MKDKVLERAGLIEVSAIEMYTDIFRLGEGWIQQCNEEPGLRKTNPIAVVAKEGYNRKIIMFEDQFNDWLEKFKEYDRAFMSGLTYWGKSNVNNLQSKMYALIFDLDGVNDRRLSRFLDGAFSECYPLPNYIVLSGNGVHLYYVFEEPLNLYPNIKQPLKELKYELTNLLWNQHTSNIKRPQYQGINQAYRIPGTKTKIEGVCVRAFRLSDHPISLGYLNSFVPEEKRVDADAMRTANRVSLDEAKKLWPEWYIRRVLNEEPRKTWKTDRHVYDWWKTKIYEYAEYGHRYFCVMALAIYAVKCGIGEAELREDAYTFVEMLNSIKPDDPFTETDMEAALECYDPCYATFPRSDIERLTGIPIPENKRNGQSQWTHLQADEWEIDGETVPNPCKANRERALEKARNEGRITGRPKGSGTEQKRVLDYYRDNPGTTVKQAATALKVSESTVQKWKPDSARTRKRTS